MPGHEGQAAVVVIDAGVVIEADIGEEADMANAKYERALARARLALIAPTVDDVTAAYFDGQVEKVLHEARHRGETSDEELISTLLDAVAKKYFSLNLHDGVPDHSPDERSPKRE